MFLMLKKLFVMMLLLSCVRTALSIGMPIDPADAFQFSARIEERLGKKSIEAHWKIADGYYLYRDKFRFEISAPDHRGVQLGTPQFPQGEFKDDENFGRVEVFHHEVRVHLPLIVTDGVDRISNITLEARSQGCADMGVCYPPMAQQVLIQWPDRADGQVLPNMSPPRGAKDQSRVLGEAGVIAQQSNVRSLAPTSANLQQAGNQGRLSDVLAGEKNEDTYIARMLKNADLWHILLFFWGAGVALAFTPCMFPMIPILSGIIVGHGHDISRTRAFFLSFLYVLGMALTYAAVGVVAGLSGTLVSSVLQNPWMLGSGALIFVALSASMFGIYELQMPSFLQGKFRDEANRQKGGSTHGAFWMGVFSSAIVGPCVAAPLAGALLYIAKTGDAMLGGGALFVMALGMGLPLLLIGASARHLLPKPGPWMTAVNRFFGVLLLGVAIWLVSPVLPVIVQMLLWSALLIFSAIYLHALDPLPVHVQGWRKFGKGLGVIVLLIGVALLIGVLGGSRDPLQPLSFLRGNVASPVSDGLKFTRIRSLDDLAVRLDYPGRPVMLVFYADWCVSCKEMEHQTFSNPAVADRMRDFLLLQVDVTDDSDEGRALLRRFNLFGPPGVIFFDKQGREMPELRAVGYQPPEKFLFFLQAASMP